MPVIKCSNGKWKIGGGPCVYDTKEKAEKAYAAYRAKEHSGEENNMFHTFILKPRDTFDASSFRRTHGTKDLNGVIVSADIDVVWGKMADNEGFEAQSLKFPAEFWTEEEAENFVAKNDFPGEFEPAKDNRQDGRSKSDLHVFRVKTNDRLLHRYEMWNGTRQLVVPVVGMVEGVHNGIFYPGEEIANYVEAWNGVPVPVYHPKDMELGMPVSCNDPMIVEKQCVGRLWNVNFDPDGAKMRGEVWIDEARAKKIDATIITTILNGGQMEVSTGLWGDHEPKKGEWNGEPYEYVLRNFRPDHLALLPGELGACSWADGCGIRVNNITEEVTMPQKKAEPAKAKLPLLKGSEEVVLSLAEKFKLAIAEVSHEDIRHSLQDKLGSLLAPAQTPEQPLMDVWVREVFEDYFVYEAAADGSMKLFKQAYKIASEEVELDGNPVEVVMKTEYVALHQEPDQAAAGDDGGQQKPPVNTNKNNKEDLDMSKEEIIKSFIENEKLTFSEEDREWLVSLSEEQLVKMQANYHALEAAVPAPEDDGAPADSGDGNEPVTNADGAGEKEPKVDEPQPKTPEEFISNAPDEMREVLTNGLKMFREKKALLVKALLANKRNRFTKEQLKARSLEELENLVELSAVDVDFSANSQARHKEPKINERSEDNLGIPDPPTPVWTNEGRPDYTHMNS